MEANYEDEIIRAGYKEKQNVMHVTARNGNYIALKWYFDAMKKAGKLDEMIRVTDLDRDGNTPLFLAC